MTARSIPEAWGIEQTGSVFGQISTSTKKVKTKDCYDVGEYPVIDQGRLPVAGYIDDSEKVVNVSSPLVIFGDHTRVIKWVNFDFVPGADGTKILEPKEFLDPRFFYHQLRAIELPDKGYARHFKYLKESTFAVPPLAEQKQIAAKLDELLAQVDTLKTRVDAIPAILKRFRQSVLAAAVSGRLTEEWREQDLGCNAIGQMKKLKHHRDELFSSMHKVDKPLKRQVNPVELEAIPSTWCYSHIDPFLAMDRAGMKTGPFGTLLKKHEHTNVGIPVVGIENIERGTFLEGSKIHITEQKAEELATYDICHNDLIISRSGSVGDICVVPDNLGVMRFSTNIMRISFLENSINPQFFSHLFLGSPIVLKQVAELCKGSTRLFLNQKILSSISYPIPPLEEQTEIVHRVKQLFTFADQIEQRLKDAQSRVNHLTQSVLAKAFRGELTAEWRKQNPDLISAENSAQVLLERIKTEQANLKPRKRVRKKSAA